MHCLRMRYNCSDCLDVSKMIARCSILLLRAQIVHYEVPLTMDTAMAQCMILLRLPPRNDNGADLDNL